MNWPQLNKDYPLAYALMVSSFKCLYTSSFEQPIDDGTTDGDWLTIKIKHPLKRDLYDFFDGVDILTCIEPNSEFTEIIYLWYAGINSWRGGEKTRSKAETTAFTKAFEILNKRLEDEQIKS